MQQCVVSVVKYIKGKSNLSVNVFCFKMKIQHQFGYIIAKPHIVENVKLFKSFYKHRPLVHYV